MIVSFSVCFDMKWKLPLPKALECRKSHVLKPCHCIQYGQYDFSFLFLVLQTSGGILVPCSLHCDLSCAEFWQQCWTAFSTDYMCCSENPYLSINKCRSAEPAGYVRQERGWVGSCLVSSRWKTETGGQKQKTVAVAGNSLIATCFSKE